MALDRETFHGLAAESLLTRELIERAIQQRLAQLAAKAVPDGHELAQEATG